MIKVRGSDPETVDLPDLNDRVYYGQEKLYSEAQYSRSQDLKKEIQKGRLTLIERREDVSADFKVPDYSNVPKQVIQSPVEEPQVKEDYSNKLELLLKKVADLENELKEKKESKQDNSQELLNQILLAIKSSPTPSPQATPDQMVDIKDHLLKLSSKIEGISSGDPVSKNKEITEEAINKRMEEIYVPSITVQDSQNNVNLEVRVVSQKDNMSDTLDKLKKLKK